MSKKSEQPEEVKEPELPDRPEYETVVKEVAIAVTASKSKISPKMVYPARYNPYDDTLTIETRITLEALDLLRARVDDVKKRLEIDVPYRER